MSPSFTPDREEQANQPAGANAAPEETSAAPIVPDAAEQPTATPVSPVTPAGANPASTVSLVGQWIGEFELLSELGRGGMGVVYKAQQTSLDRVVAIKMLLAEHFQDAVLLTRFVAEAKTAAALDHPNIVKIYQIGSCPAGQYFVMEFIDGQTLEAILHKGPFGVPASVALLAAVADAVHYAHGKGVIHRDLKPANVMLDRFRRPVVMDFGIAKFEGRSPSLTQQGAIMGTPAYMPPEQAGDDLGPVGPHSDVYSLGAILYALLTGRPPYEGSTPLKTVLKVVGPEPPASIRRLRADVPVALEEICMKCLSKRPEDRYASARALAEGLRRFRAASSWGKPAAPTQRASLPTVVLVERSTGKRIRLAGKVNVLGRASDCDVIVRAADVSKRHCRILIEPDRVDVEDLGSVNGTRVNGESVGRCQLADGDELDVAGRVFVVELPKAKP